MLLISPEGTVLLSPVRTHDLGPCHVTGNHIGLFTHLAGALRKWKVGRTSEEPFRGQGVCVSNGSNSTVGAQVRVLGPLGFGGWERPSPLPLGLSLLN